MSTSNMLFFVGYALVNDVTYLLPKGWVAAASLKETPRLEPGLEAVARTAAPLASVDSGL